jgi:hypothetical protein
MSSIGSIGSGQTRQAIEVAVLKKELDAEEIKGEAVQKLIEQAAETVEPVATDPDAQVGQQLDIFV